VLRLERMWALANVLASSEERPTQGLRGVMRTAKVAQELRERGATRTAVNFQILSRQERYGVIGIYGNVADELRLLDRKTLALTPDLGDRLGEAFHDATEMPVGVRRAALKGEDVALGTLAAWGERSHLSAATGKVEARCLGDALHRDPVRTRMVELLDETPWKKAESELGRLERILKRIADDDERRNLYEAVRCILAFEDCYVASVLGFERLIWFCRNVPSSAVPAAELGSDPVIRELAGMLADRASNLERAITDARTDWVRRDLGRLDDVVSFLRRAGAGRADDVVGALLERHEGVQRGKWDQGRPKLPWIRRYDGRIALTLANAGSFEGEPKNVREVAPHPYRLSAADALSSAARAA
jgi:hypothetical protein